MICPHCGKEIEQQPTVNLFNPINVNGCNAMPVTLVFNNAACANAFPAMTLNHQAFLNNGCNPIPQVTFIKF